MNKIESVPLMGIRVDRVTMERTLALVEQAISMRCQTHIVTLDASMCVLAQSDYDLRRIINDAELVTPDSAGVLWACRRMGYPLRERVSGVEIVDSLCEVSARFGYKIYFLGASIGIAAEAAEKMQGRYPGCTIVGADHGFFTEQDEPHVLERIRDARPDILCVAMGIPRQEKWIARHREFLGVPVMIGVGGTFDVLSGRVKRAPRWMQAINVEWLYRLAMNPRKIGKVLTLPRFVSLVLNARPAGDRDRVSKLENRKSKIN